MAMARSFRGARPDVPVRAPGDVESGRSIRSQPGRKVKLLLVDRGTVVREGLRALVEKEPDLVVVAHAASLVDLVNLNVTPDVIVTDVDLPDARHGEVITGLRGLFPSSPILVLTLVCHPAKVQPVLAAGAEGYLLKTAEVQDLLSGIRALGRGDTYVQPSVRIDLDRWREAQPTAPDLTTKEERVLRLLARGYSNEEVAMLSRVSRRTIETHRARIHHKLGLRTRAELFQYASDAGLVEFDR